MRRKAEEVWLVEHRAQNGVWCIDSAHRSSMHADNRARVLLISIGGARNPETRVRRFIYDPKEGAK